MGYAVRSTNVWDCQALVVCRPLHPPLTASLQQVNHQHCFNSATPAQYYKLTHATMTPQKAEVSPIALFHTAPCSEPRQRRILASASLVPAPAAVALGHPSVPVHTCSSPGARYNPPEPMPGSAGPIQS